jgi:HEAT repeat protein
MSTWESGKGWPLIKAVGGLISHIRIPGTDLTLETAIDTLSGLQDDLDSFYWEEKVTAALDAIRASTQEIAKTLAEKGQAVGAQEIDEGRCEFAESLYRADMARSFQYTDFKGVEQDLSWLPMELDEVFVDLKLRPERDASDDPHLEQDERLRQALLTAKLDEREEMERELIERDALRLTRATKEGMADPIPVDRVLAKRGGYVFLGGPGSGKTTLVKRLARSCALGQEALCQRYPALPSALFPVVVPLTMFNDQREKQAADLSILRYIETWLTERRGRSICEVFQQQWGLGRCLVLLDGLDEVAQADHRVRSARAVGEFYQQLDGNLGVATSRKVGYNVCRLNVPAGHFELEPFERGDVERFVRQWHSAREKAVHPKAPDLERAARDALAMIDEIHARPAVASLASNPLMLTIIALIKQRDVRLPERRVELYETAINTLLRGWNNARSLSGLPLGAEPKLDHTKRVWAAVAHWMHADTDRGTLHRNRLQQELVRVLEDIGDMNTLDAEAEAESYLKTAAESTGILEARGHDMFAFVHQTFQEYLAADSLAIPTRKAVERIRGVAADPRWREPICLAAGIIGIYQRDDECLAELIDCLLREDDPLEPYLCARLRLAAACVADNVGFRQAEVDRVIVRIVERLEAFDSPALNLLTDALRLLPLPQPDRISSTALNALCRLSEHNYYESRMEAARKLALVASRHPEAKQALERCPATDSECVSEHVAVGLWRAGAVLDDGLAKRILSGLSNGEARLSLVAEEPLVAAAVRILGLSDPSSRVNAVRALVTWGEQSQALPAVLALLDQEDAFVRLDAAEVLGNWGRQSQVLPAVLKVLKHEDTLVRLRAADLLGRWGQQSQALPAVLKVLNQDAGNTVGFLAAGRLARSGMLSHRLPTLLKRLGHVDAGARWWWAADLLSKWGQQSEALPAILKLLDHEDAEVRLSAADLLGKWGQQSQALPVALKDLEHEDAMVRLSVAELLGKWGRQSQAMPAVLKLRDQKDAIIRLGAAKLLGMWGQQSQALPAVLEVLEHENAGVRLDAAELLGEWGQQSQALPAVLKLLDQEKGSVRLGAADLLSKWGQKSQGSAAVLRVLDGGDADFEPDTIQLLDRWGPSDGIGERVLETLGCGSEQRKEILEALAEPVKPWPQEVAAALGAMLKPSRSEPPLRCVTRGVLLRWIWSYSNGS